MADPAVRLVIKRCGNAAKTRMTLQIHEILRMGPSRTSMFGLHSDVRVLPDQAHIVGAQLAENLGS